MGRQIKDRQEIDYSLPYGTGCFTRDTGETFCDDCENCPLDDCEAGYEPSHKLRFKTAHSVKMFERSVVERIINKKVKNVG